MTDGTIIKVLVSRDPERGKESTDEKTEPVQTGRWYEYREEEISLYLRGGKRDRSGDPGRIELPAGDVGLLIRFPDR